jgi:flavodoxin
MIVGRSVVGTTWVLAMRRFVFSFVYLVFGVVVAPAATSAPAPEKVLIVYLSRTNNTKVLAETIHRYVGGDLVRLELQEPYPKNYEQIVHQVARENETGFLPPLRTRIRDIANYDVIFVGFPTWGMQLPPPIKSFLKQYDLSGKKVVPFNSNGGYGLGTSFQTVRELCPKSQVLEGYSVKGGSERDGVLLGLQGKRAEQARDDVRQWLQRLDLVN